MNCPARVTGMKKRTRLLTLAGVIVASVLLTAILNPKTPTRTIYERAEIGMTVAEVRQIAPMPPGFVNAEQGRFNVTGHTGIQPLEQEGVEEPEAVDRQRVAYWIDVQSGYETLLYFDTDGRLAFKRYSAIMGRDESAFERFVRWLQSFQ